MSGGQFMVVLIVALVMITIIMRSRFQHQREPQKAENPETERLRDEVKELKERIHVLERIATDRENSLAREIEELRSPNASSGDKVR